MSITEYNPATLENLKSQLESLRQQQIQIEQQIRNFPHCPPPTCPLPAIPVDTRVNNQINQLNKEIVEDYEDMINEIEEFKSNYFFNGASYKGEINNVHREKTTSDVFQEFEDMMSPDSYNWGGWQSWNSNIRTYPRHPTNFKTVKLCTRNLNRFRKCCDDRIESIKKTIAEYDL